MKTDELMKKWADKVIASKNAKYIYDFALSMNDDLSLEEVQRLTDAIIQTYSSYHSNDNHYIYDFISDINGVSLDYIIDKFGETFSISFIMELTKKITNVPMDKISDIVIKRGNYIDIFNLIKDVKNVPTDKLIPAFMDKEMENPFSRPNKIQCIIYFVNHNIGDLNVFIDYVIKNGSDGQIYDFIVECKALDDGDLDKLVDGLMVAPDAKDDMYRYGFHEYDNVEGKYMYIVNLAAKGIGNVEKYADLVIASQNFNNIYSLASVISNNSSVFARLVEEIAKIGNFAEINKMAYSVHLYKGGKLRLDLLDMLSNALVNYNDKKAKTSAFVLAINIKEFIKMCNFYNESLLDKLLETRKYDEINEIGIYFCQVNNSSQLVHSIEKIAKVIAESGNINLIYKFLINSNGYAIDILIKGIKNSKNALYIHKAQEYLIQNGMADFMEELTWQDDEMANEFMEFMLQDDNQEKTVHEAIEEYNAMHPKHKVMKKTIY